MKPIKLALCTTTIHVPALLALMQAHVADRSPTEFMMFVAGDHKTPKEAYDFCNALPNCVAFSPEIQNESGFVVNDMLGWNTVARRNIATLCALKWDADIIVLWDDDNAPMSSDYFDTFEMLLTGPFSGLRVSGFSNWFDPGSLLLPPAQQRGFPFDKPALWRVDSVVGAKIGIASGAILGDPDLDAITRMTNRHAPINVQSASELLRSGVAVDFRTWTITNSQNTAFARELAPAFLMCPQLGRHDDIFSSLIAQRVARERGLLVHHGQPFCYQQRNQHNTMRDFQMEALGMQHVSEFGAWLEHVHLVDGDSVLGHVQTIYGQMKELAWMPAGVSELGLAWVQDCEKVLG